MLSVRWLLIFGCTMAACADLSAQSRRYPMQRSVGSGSRYSGYDYTRPQYYGAAHYPPPMRADRSTARYAAPEQRDPRQGVSAGHMEYPQRGTRRRVPPYAWGWFGVRPKSQNVVRTRSDRLTDWQVRYGD